MQGPSAPTDDYRELIDRAQARAPLERVRKEINEIGVIRLLDAEERHCGAEVANAWKAVREALENEPEPALPE